MTKPSHNIQEKTAVKKYCNKAATTVQPTYNLKIFKYIFYATCGDQRSCQGDKLIINQLTHDYNISLSIK